jgi:hypothetical protein
MSMGIFAISPPCVYVEIEGACGGVAGSGGGASGGAGGAGGNGACGSGFGGGGIGRAAGGCGSGFGAHAHGISDPGHSHGFGSVGGGCMGDVDPLGPTAGLDEFLRAMTQAIARSMSMPVLGLEPPANYLACPSALAVREIGNQFSWQDE